MRRLILYTFAAILIGGAFLYLAARELPFSEVGDYFSNSADFGHLATWSAVFVFAYAVCHAARVLRWYYLVYPIDADVDAKIVHRVCLVGLSAILVLPLRLGEFVRPFMLSRKTTIPMSAALGTAVVERVVDGLTITGLLFITLATYDGSADTGSVRLLGAVSAAIFIPALVVSIVAYWRREWTVSLVRRLVGIVSTKLADKLAGLLDAFIVGFRSLAEGASLSKFLGLTVVYWVSNAGSMWIFAHYGFGFEIDLWQTVTVLAVLVVGIMIPAGPGMAGNFQYFLLLGMGLFVAVEGTEAAGKLGALGAAMHVLQFIVILVPGLMVLVSDPESWRAIKDRALQS